ncbi:hypothetical protein ACOSQ3_002486 [Xanthoceras sorbifolium]
MHSRIVKATKNSRLLRMSTAGNAEYELLDKTRAYVTKLNNSTCEREIWQISGVPCSHSLTGISHYCRANNMSERVIDFVDPILSKSAFMRTYASMIHPIPDQCVWTDFHTHSTTIEDIAWQT